MESQEPVEEKKLFETYGRGTIYGPSHPLYDQKEWIKLANRHCKETREEMLEAIGVGISEEKKRQNKLLLQEQTKKLAQKIYFSVLHQEADGVKILELYEQYEQEWDTLTTAELIYFPGVFLWYEEQQSYVKSCFKYWRRAMKTSIERGKTILKGKKKEK